MNYLEKLGQKAKMAATSLNKMKQNKKNEVLENCAKTLLDAEKDILAANENDIQTSINNGIKSSLIDRLRLTPERLKDMADGLLELRDLPDPVGKVLSMDERPNGLLIGRKVVPLGVIGIIYESRPNVTSDAFGLCFKSGNAVVLRGGSDAIATNKAIVKALRNGLKMSDANMDAIQLIEDTSRETAAKFMKLNQYIDVLIPRGGSGLIKSVVENSTIPVIETGTGNCHIYVDKYADFSMALDIIDNAKTQRIGVCNTCESLVVHKDISEEFIPLLYQRLHSKDVEIRADKIACSIVKDCIPATEEDFATEYLDKIVSLKVVNNIDEAISHINEYNSKHSEAIITEDYNNSLKFLNEVDAAAIYVNASTRFTDGNEFGFGAEIGISTQKLHARGPMGLEALTTSKFIILGNGQIRN